MTKEYLYYKSSVEQKEFTGVIFDMDGVIFDTERIQDESWKQAAKEIGLVDDMLFKSLIGSNIQRADTLIQERFGKDFDIDALRKRKRELVIKWHEKNGMPVKKGILEIIQFLQDNNIPFGIASSSDYSRIIHCLSRANMLPMFNIIMGGDQVTNSKPDPEIFIKTGESLNIPPDKILVFEDSPAGLKAAKAAGMIPIHIPDLVLPTEETKKDSFDIAKTITDVIGKIITS
jgi:beta-phosphoglucomutase